MTDDIEPEVPFHRIVLGPDERRAITQVFDRGWLTTGPVAAEFERRFAAQVRASHAVATSSGTAALELALAALDIGVGDTVITTPYSFTATAEVILRRGAKVVFADVEQRSLNLSPTSTRAAIARARATGANVRAVLLVHFGGAPCDLARFDALAAAEGVDLIEDAAHALPAFYGGAPIGSERPDGRTRATCFSLYANKTLTAGEGGVLVTPDAELGRRVRRLSLHGMDRDAWRRQGASRSWEYDVTEIGIKGNLSDVAAAIGLARLDRMAADHAERIVIAQTYRRRLADLPIEHPVDSKRHRSAWHLYPIRVEGGAEPVESSIEPVPEGAEPIRSSIEPVGDALRNIVVDHLAARGIGTSVHYRPLHLHTAYASRDTGAEPLPVASLEWQRELSLPIYPGLTSHEIDRVVAALAEALAGW